MHPRENPGYAYVVVLGCGMEYVANCAAFGKLITRTLGVYLIESAPRRVFNRSKKLI